MKNITEKIFNPRKALNKAFLKIKPSRDGIELFKNNLINLLDHIKETESEEFHKNLVSDFLKNTYFNPDHFINTKGRNDLVIHNGKSSDSSVGVIIEAKKPSNKTEMIKTDDLNSKAFQELILYFLRERITGKNLEVKYLIATNIYEWFIFDANIFEKLFSHNKELVKQFTDFEEGRLSGKDTGFFYNQIAEPFIKTIESELVFAYFNIKDYEAALRNTDKKDDNVLIALYKLLSPEHLLKLPFTNDSNSLDKSFYTELLHIIGLTETKDGSKKLIERKKDKERNSNSLLESTINQLDTLDKISRLDKAYKHGKNNEENLFNTALELVITWIDRILFLKLLEAQQINYHKGNNEYSFLNIKKIENFDELNTLFFSVLAKLYKDRNPEVKEKYKFVPYLNSSLFEPTELEQSCFFISQLKDGKIPVISSTILKDVNGKKRIGEINALEYLFEFLNAYDFSSEGSEEIQEENKTLINASVLGLIFEKINGYKDGSFFTPGFITMYMCHETIRQAVIQKFNEVKGWNIKDLNELYNKIEDIKEADEIINSLKICDLAVGSGHFLVSALNEIIAVKSELKILIDKNGKKLKDYNIEVVNDELVVADEDGEIFSYNPSSKESQRIQETLFNEKQTIIENCLFGVDINTNSVKICRLRLWIELLKNAYYTEESGFTELETLPNIDINIKCGNSLISRFDIDVDIKKELKKLKYTVKQYKDAVYNYKNASSKDEKRELVRLINDIKSNFQSEVEHNDKRIRKIFKLSAEYDNLGQGELFELSKKELEEKEKRKKAINDEIKKIQSEIEEIKNNKIYENAFEWRFEFPEVLNDDGDFVGFDVVIGNPPYIPGKDIVESFRQYIKNNYKFTAGKFDVYLSFIEKGLQILTHKSNLCFIIPNTFLVNENAKLSREYLISSNLLNKITVLDENVFDEAFVESIILQIYRIEKQSIVKYQDKDFNFIRNIEYNEIKESTDCRIQVYCNETDNTVINKINLSSIKLGEIIDFCIGIQIGGEGDSKDFKLKYISNIKLSDDYKKMLDGKDFKPFLISWSNKFIKYGEWLHRKRDDKYFLNPKLMIRQIGETPIATVDFDGYYTLNTIYNGIINNHEYDINYVFAQINSKLNKYIWKKKYYDGKALFPKIKKSQLVEIPIAKIKKNEQQVFTNLVTQILTAKKSDPNANTSELEAEIDRLVYELYGLTEDEIKIVEEER